jgi:agmatine/peptidylarginine deiminase
MSHRVAGSFRLCVSVLTIWSLAASLPAGEQDDGLRKLPRLAAEFESQDAILVSWNADDEGVEEALAAIVSAVHRNLQVIVLTPDDEYLRSAMQCFSLAGIPRASVRYVRARVDTIWTRDYGPASIRAADGTFAIIDADYETGARTHDDHLPAAIAPILGLSSIHVPLTIEGGNLLSNGHGLGIATTKLRDANLLRGYAEERLRGLLRDVYGFSQTVLLEPLDGEPTGHVDMFATFVSPHVVVVGEYDPAVDPVNADVLDRNAERLAAVRTPWGRLRVVRVPMPPSGPDVWRTYTNVLYANGTLLVPSYPGITPDYEQEALDVFRQLLPGWRIVPVDCNQLIALGGGIHCITMNLSRIGRLPRAVEPHELPGAGGPFPGDEAAPGLIVDRVGWQIVAGDVPRRQPGRIEEATFERAESALDVPDECRRCCPRAEAGLMFASDTPASGPRSARGAGLSDGSPRVSLPLAFPATPRSHFGSPHHPPPAAGESDNPGWRPARPARPARPLAADSTAGSGADRLGRGSVAGLPGFVAPRRGVPDSHRGFASPGGDSGRARLAPGWSN